MSTSGYFRIDRDIFVADWLSQDKPWDSLTLWLFLLSRACSKGAGLTYHGHRFDLNRGQLVTSQDYLCEQAGWTRKRLRVFLAKLRTEGRVNIVATDNGTIITMCDYDLWEAPVFTVETLGQVKGQVSTAPELVIDATRGQVKGQVKGQVSAAPQQAIDGDRGQVKGQVSDTLERGQVKGQVQPASPQAETDTRGQVKGQQNNKEEEKTRISTKDIVGAGSDAQIVLAYLNQKLGTHYSNPGLIPARLHDHHTVEECERVIDIKCDEWIGTEWEKALNAVSLFRPANFDRYLNQKPRPRGGNSGTNQQRGYRSPIAGEGDFTGDDFIRGTGTAGPGDPGEVGESEEG